jgi:hypothetical protein
MDPFVRINPFSDIRSTLFADKNTAFFISISIQIYLKIAFLDDKNYASLNILTKIVFLMQKGLSINRIDCH